MKACLLFPDRNYDPEQTLCPDCDTLEKDLGIRFLLEAMSEGDELIAAVSRRVLFSPLTDERILRFRQDALRDALDHPEIIRELYAICVEAEELRRKSWNWLSSSYISGTFSASLTYLGIYLKNISKMKDIAEKQRSFFKSEGFSSLFEALCTELNEEYLKETSEALISLKDTRGMLIHARPGSFLQGVEYFLCRPEKQKFSLLKRFEPAYRIRGDDNTAQEDLNMRYNRAINELTNALAQAAEHLLAYFNMLRTELSFFVGCMNLRDTLAKRGQDVCIPRLLPSGTRSRKGTNLYDAGVALTKGSADGNDLDAVDTDLYLITGANQGGKSTFLRSVGQCQLMGQCGMFVCASSMELPLRTGIFTHFKREEDDKMESGKLDEELARMSRIIDSLRPGSMILFNESFAATNEREGSEICRQITSALLESGMEIFSVSHLMTYVESFAGNQRACFLQAERLPDGTRTHRILQGKPTKTAWGMDIYREIFNVMDGEI